MATPLFQQCRRRRWAHLATLLVAFVLVTPSGCSNDSGGSEQGPNVSPVLETDRQASATIGIDGGSIEATGSDGTEYTLTIPAEALIADTEITITPILDIADLPMSGGLVGGAHFEPSGLELFRTASLRVVLPAAPDLGSDELLAGFTYDNGGNNLGLSLVQAEGDSFTLPILHFSGGGGGAATPSDLDDSFAPGTVDAFIAELLEMGADHAAILQRWYDELVKPALQAAAASDQALDRAFDEYWGWLNTKALAGDPPALDGPLSESQTLALAAFRDALARANDLCERQESFAEAEKALTWLLRAEGVLPESVLAANQLDRDTVRADLCLQVVFESTSFPQAPVVGQAATLSGVVGYAFGGGATQFAPGMDAGIGATGASPANSIVMTNASGEFEQTLTPMGPGVTIEINACIGNVAGAGPATGSLVCQDAFIVRGLVVDPASVTLAPGGSQPFTAMLGGQTTAVTWQATGGTIDGNGLYTAGGIEGTFSVTATSIDDSSLTFTATVVIAMSDIGFREFEGLWFGTLVTADGNDLCGGVDGRCVTFDFGQISGPEFVNLRACQGSCEIFGFWTGGSITGNVFTAEVHSTRTVLTDRPTAEPCPVTLTLETDPDGTQHVRGQLQGFGATCGGDGFSTANLVR